MIDLTRTMKHNPVASKLLKNQKLLLIIIIIVALFLRFWRLGYPDVDPDEGHYAYDAYHLYKANPGMVCRFHTQYHYQEQLGHPCLTQYLIAISYKLFSPSVFTARLVPAIFGSLIISLIYFISQSIFTNPLVSLTAASIYALFPLAVKFDRTTYLDTLMAFMVAVFLAVFIKFNKSKKPIYSILLGITTGLLLLTKLSAILILIFLLLDFSISLKKNYKQTVTKYFFVFLGFIPVFFLGVNPQAYLNGIINPTDQNFAIQNLLPSLKGFIYIISKKSFVQLIPPIYLVFVLLGLIKYIQNKKPAFLLLYLFSWLPLAGSFILGRSNFYRLLPLVVLTSFLAAYYLSLLKANWQKVWIFTLLLWFLFASIKWGINEVNQLKPIDAKVMKFLESSLTKQDKIYLFELPNNYIYWNDKLNLTLNPDWQNVILEDYKCVLSTDLKNQGQMLNQSLLSQKHGNFSLYNKISNNSRSILIFCQD